MSASKEKLLTRAELMLKETRVLGLSDDASFSDHVKIVSVEPGRVDVKFEVTENLLNIRGYVHGGVLAFLVDVITFMSTSTLLPFEFSAVSLNLNTNFVKGIKHGETIYATAVAVRAGKKIIFAKVHFRDADGNLRAYGGQTIYILDEGNPSQVNSSTQLNEKSKL
ncbi:Acyl-coenzyme A thioesterase 13 [Holothuria leucospilota]|uniref:Acyl-coenzyme A thioesterase 13 n=1 Tax=Holothuria leucospilota TaxID=206669 RepID=A0A9Q1H679_HOLLE|nr:Acyl-coenzyme A thioesterase 13 [Holothuria leucospilota]